MSTTNTSERFTALPDDQTLAATVVALEEHGFSVEVVDSLEADRMRTALLAAVSHDLRTPLAAAKAAISGLRSRDIQLTAADHDDLLATADESLDLLTHLVANLLDVTRLQAGARSVFPGVLGLSVRVLALSAEPQVSGGVGGLVGISIPIRAY